MNIRKRLKRDIRSYLFSAGLLLIIWILQTVLTLFCLTPKRYSLDENGAPTETIYAEYTSVDTVATETARQNARNQIPTQYKYDRTIVESMQQEMSDLFEQIGAFRERAFQIRTESQLLPGQDERTWQEVIPEDSLSLMMAAITKLNISDPSIGYAILDAEPDVLEELHSILHRELNEAMDNGGEGLRYDLVTGVRNAISEQIQNSAFPVHLKNFGEMLLTEYLKPTLIVDTDATIRLQEETAAEVESIYIQRGDLLAEKGVPLTSVQKQLLLSLDLLAGGSRNRLFIPGVAAYLALFYLIFYIFLVQWEPEVLKNWRKASTLSLVLFLNFVFQWVAHTIDPRLMTAAFSVLLCAALFAPRTCVGVLLLTCMTFPAIAARTSSGIFSTETAAAFASLFVSGISILFVMQNKRKRMSLLISGVLGSVLYCITISACYMVVGYAWNRQRLVFLGSQALTIVMISLLCTGIAGILESVFDLLTNARLYELSNLNHPLLRRLMQKAPGTFQHSITAAALAENAAYEIGVNSLLAKDGALYHDVGKIRRPEYYGENQKGKNIHDTFKPKESAEFIISHVHDAEPILKKYHLPNEIRKIVKEHHGTTLVEYFYRKALETREKENSTEPVQEEDFRYHGDRPSTAESAIVMLADSCEAAVRSLNNPDQETVRETIRKVVSGKIQDGQLSESPLTLAQIETIENSFLLSLNGLMHERIPGQEEIHD